MDVPGLISLALFYGAVLCVGLYAGRKSMRSSDSGLLLADRRILHGVTEIHPLDPARPAWRDALVVTFAAV